MIYLRCTPKYVPSLAYIQTQARHNPLYAALSFSKGGYMDDRKIEYIAFESVCARFERINKRLWILCIILAIMLITTNIAWLYYVQQFEQFETTVTQDNADGYNNYIGNDGDIINGTTDY